MGTTTREALGATLATTRVARAARVDLGGIIRGVITTTGLLDPPARTLDVLSVTLRCTATARIKKLMTPAAVAVDLVSVIYLTYYKTVY